MQSDTYIERLLNQKFSPSESQLEAITTTEGPLLIIAGAGSGKTKTLVDRIVYLISKGNNQRKLWLQLLLKKLRKN